jgi:hypothetical protein
MVANDNGDERCYMTTTTKEQRRVAKDGPTTTC